YRVEDEMIFDLCNRVCDRLATRLEEQARNFRVLNSNR
ncbi:MAG: transcriptional regulator, partial [Nostoc sp.]